MNKTVEKRYTYQEFLNEYYPKTEENKFEEICKKYEGDPEGLGRELAKRIMQKVHNIERF